MERFEFVRFASGMGIPFIDLVKDEISEDFKEAHRATKKGKK
jgi:hypothetical protein